MRQRGASIFIYLIFGLLIVIFVINFAPNAGQGGGGCSGSSHVVIDVDGNRVSENPYKVAYSSPFNGYQGAGKKFHALDTLIRRELLAAAAADLGIRPNREMVDEEIKKGYFFTGGERRELGDWLFDTDVDGKPFWSRKKFDGLVQHLNVSKNAFLEEQVRGLQAALMAELLASSAQVSRDEALNDFLFDRNTVAYDVVTFSPAAYRTAMLLTEADVERFLAAHEDQVKARHKEKEREFLGRKPELKLRQIFIAKLEPEEKKPEEKKPEEKKPEEKKPDDKKAEAKPGDAKPADAKTAEAKPADPKAADAKKPDDKDKKDGKAGDAAKPVGMPIAEAKTRLEAARDAVVSGKQKFADLAKQLNTDPVLKASGGDAGWKTAESASLGEKVVSDAVKSLKPGEMTQVITTDRGAYLVLAEAKREKDLTYDQVKHELAAELAREVWSKEAAKRDAIKALEEARAGKKKLGEMYQREFKPGMDLQELYKRMNDPGTDPKIKQMIQQQLEQQLQRQFGGEEHGSIVIESPDVLAAWKAGDGAPSGGAAPAPAAGSAAPAPAAGSAGPAPTAGAPAAGAPQAAPKPAPLAPSSDVLPAFHDLSPPKVVKEGPHPRQKRLPGVDTDGVKALFDELGKDDLAPRVFESDGNYTVVQVVDKAQAKIDDFEKDSARIIHGMREERGRQLVHDWVMARCEELKAANKIRPRPDMVREGDGKEETRYTPCMTLR